MTATVRSSDLAVFFCHWTSAFIFYAGCVLDETGSRSLIIHVLQVLQIKYEPDLPEGVEYSERESEGIRYGFLFNCNYERKKLRFRGEDTVLEPFEMKISTARLSDEAIGEKDKSEL
jgi:hypothetical protein